MRVMSQPARIAAILLLIASHAPADAIRYTLTDLDPGSTKSSTAYAINASGQVTGTYIDMSNAYHAFLVTNGTLQDIALVTGGVAASGYGLNASGHVVGQLTVAMGISHPFFYNGTAMAEGSKLGGTHALARSINVNDYYAGESQITGDTAYHAYYYDGTAHDLGTLGGTNSRGYSINVYSQVVGYSQTNTAVYHAFLYSGMTMTDLGTLGGDYSIAYAISDQGHIVGGAKVVSGKVHAFYWGNALQMIDLGTVDGGDSYAFALNNSDQVVGTASINDGAAQHAIIHENGVMRDLNTRLDKQGSAGWELNYAYGINDSGLIVGYGTYQDQGHAFLLTPHNVPSPTLRYSGKRKIRTTKARLTISGTTGGEVDSVTSKIGKKSGVASGTAHWIIKAKLSLGKNVITIIAHGYGGNSKPVKILITRT